MCENLNKAGPIGSGCDYTFGWMDTIPDYAFENLSRLEKVTAAASIRLTPGDNQSVTSDQNTVLSLSCESAGVTANTPYRLIAAAYGEDGRFQGAET